MRLAAVEQAGLQAVVGQAVDIAIKAGPGRWLLRESVARYCDDLRRQAKGMGGEAAVAVVAAERGRLAKAQADLEPV